MDKYIGKIDLRCFGTRVPDNFVLGSGEIAGMYPGTKLNVPEKGILIPN